MFIFRYFQWHDTAWYATYNTAVLHFTFIRSHRILEPLRTCVCPSSNTTSSERFLGNFEPNMIFDLNFLPLYNTLVLPTFLYGSENWTLTASQRRRIEAVEMKLLRLLAGYTLYDHKTNDYIRRELQITGILDKIDEYRRNWFQHLQRMPQNRIPLKSYHWRPQGRRTIGRPKKRWRQQL